MLIIRRWYVNYGSKLVWAVVALAIGWFLRQTQGAPLLELYYWVSRPFHSAPPSLLEERLTNARIVELEQRLAELERQNQQLQRLLGYYQQQQAGVITAPIIGRSTDDWWKQVIIGRGSQDGIKVGYVVTGIGGLIGRVIDVTPNTSRVLLVSDPTSRVGATVSRSRTMGVVEGESAQIAVMRFFEKVPQVRPGDTITTSPVSRLFPGGLPIGQVESVNLEKSPAPEAKIRLTAPINDLEWAIVHPFESQ
ncbi:Rod shape-determining protein MreC [Rippkaea orientalis PCC 8801]|uniref:Cell shape-determining protein MreC n=1 Tax=Rippkaea orientalis (strain PCC 8801 / RF-1) TaxID=41431 RepID=B7K608_RIPO1|nr:rod shape-determining protein MreC [Rippkaea orientalis]ACK68061.1 Rod shape-determining protein MreC [Rippkaea orientalis PCC 8801]